MLIKHTAFSVIIYCLTYRLMLLRKQLVKPPSLSLPDLIGQSRMP